MEESSIYQAILNKGLTRGQIEGRVEGRVEGRAAGLFESILRIGRHRFRTEPPQMLVQRLSTIKEIPTLEALEDRALDATNWDEMLMN